MERLDPRKEQILALVVREYITTAEPVGSKHLEAGCGFSAATIRNEMVALTDLGYLSQPHTSAGRIPTELGYRYYIEHSLTESQPEVKPFRDAWDEQEGDGHRLRQVARILAKESGNSVFICSGDEVYVTGLSFLFGQPEFSSRDLLHDVSAAIDALDERIADLRTRAHESLTLMLGSENPLHVECSTMMLRTGDASVVLGVLGPMRMDYDRVMPLLQGIRKLMQE